MEAHNEAELVTQESSETTASAPRKASGQSGLSPILNKSQSPLNASGHPATQSEEDAPQHPKTEPSRRPYDCNICFEDATDPVVTRCGHLYCWPCLHGWLERGILECPVCKAGATQESVIPIYGQGSEGSDPRTKSVPHRPRGERASASAREQRRDGGGGGSSSFSFGVFPLGVSMTFNTSNWFGAQPQGGLSREEQLNQAVSLLFLFAAIFLTVWILLMEGSGSDF